MKDKFSSFLVRRSKIILIIFIALAVGFAALIPFVNVNHDTTKYLPHDSSMKKGMDLMKAEFGKESRMAKVMPRAFSAAISSDRKAHV